MSNNLDPRENARAVLRQHGLFGDVEEESAV